MSSDSVGPGEGWIRAVAKAGLLLAAAFAGFAILPDWLVGFLSPRVSPGIRDALIAAWVTVFFVVMCWGLVAAQRRSEG